MAKQIGTSIKRQGTGRRIRSQETHDVRRSEDRMRSTFAEGGAALSLWKTWRGPPALVAQIARRAQDVVKSAEDLNDLNAPTDRFEIEVQVGDDSDPCGPDTETFSDVDSFLNNVTADALKHFACIGIHAQGPRGDVQVALWSRKSVVRVQALRRDVQLDVGRRKLVIAKYEAARDRPESFVRRIERVRPHKEVSRRPEVAVLVLGRLDDLHTMRRVVSAAVARNVGWRASPRENMVSGVNSADAAIPELRKGLRPQAPHGWARVGLTLSFILVVAGLTALATFVTYLLGSAVSEAAVVAAWVALFLGAIAYTALVPPVEVQAVSRIGRAAAIAYRLVIATAISAIVSGVVAALLARA